MPSRPFPESQSLSPSKTRVLFLVLTISSFVVILFSVLYFLYYLWFSLVSRTIPFDSSAPLRFTYRELKIASAGANIIGKGGSGTVFRGVLRDGKLIAIKRLDALSLQTEREFQNELHILGGLRSPFVVPLLGYCVHKSKRILVYEYVPNGSLQEHLFADEMLNLTWDRRFNIILDVARALEFLHLGCDPPVIHGDIKPANVLLDSDFRARVSDFGLARLKVEDEFGVDLFSQELSGTLPPAVATPEVDFALALQLQASSSSRNSPSCYSVKALNYIGSESEGKGKDVWSLDLGEDGNSKELRVSEEVRDTTQWGEDWWWRQDEGGELSSKDYVKEWIGSQISPPTDPDWDEGNKSIFEEENQNPKRGVEGKASKGKKKKKKHRKMQEWWKEERLAETKWKKGFKMPRFGCRRQKKIVDTNGDFSFRKGWKKRNNQSFGSDMLSSTTSMRGTLCYVAPEYGGCGYLMEKADIYSLGVVILVIVSGRRPLHVLASPMKFEKANLISWCRHLAQAGNILELVDERLKEEYNKEQARLSINLALSCLQKMPELRPEIDHIVKVLKGEMDLASMPFQLSSSPPSKLYKRKQKVETD